MGKCLSFIFPLELYGWSHFQINQHNLIFHLNTFMNYFKENKINLLLSNKWNFIIKNDDINNYFLKSIRNVAFFFCIFTNLFNDYLNRSWILISVSVFNLLRYALLVEIYKDNPASQRYIFGKGWCIIIASSDNCGYSSILYRILTSGSF